MELIFINEFDNQFNNYEGIFMDLAHKTFELTKQNDNVSFEVNLISNQEIQDINKEYRGIDSPTDVISFAFFDEVAGDVKIKGDFMMLLGEIFISVEKAKSQAKEYGHPLIREMSFLFVHGLLHLLGYDHDDNIKEKEMFDLQEKILENKEIK